MKEPNRTEQMREHIVDPILLIDDEESTLTILSEILENEGYTVLVARNGEEGLTLFDSNRISLVITDMIMPVKDGLDTMLELAKKNSHIPIVAISAGGAIPKERYLEMAGHFKNTSTLAKPFTSDELLAVVHNMLCDDEPHEEGISL